MPEIHASRPSEKIDHTKCGLPVVEEPPPEEVTRLLEEFPDVFAELPKGLPKSQPTNHPIVVDETQTPPAHRLYRMPAADQEEIKRQVEELVAAGRIRPSTSPFGASAMLRDKKDKSRRMVIDYRALNKLTRKDK